MVQEWGAATYVLNGVFLHLRLLSLPAYTVKDKNPFPCSLTFSHQVEVILFSLLQIALKGIWPILDS